MQSWICSKSMNDITAGSSNAVEFQPNATTPTEPQAASATDCSIQKIMKTHDHWRHPLAHLQVLIRIVICCGITGNPHLIIQKNELISKTTKKPITEDEILKLALALGMVHMDNGFYQFLIHQIAKEIVHHVIFCPTETCQVELTIADLEPEKFHNAPHLPWEAMVFFASSCYEVLLKRLSHLLNYRVLLATHPSPSQVIMELKETDIQTNSQEFVSSNSPQQEPANHYCPPKDCTKGCDTLPESLMITASVVFGLVNAHDLITLIDTCLKEVLVRTQLQQEEGSCMQCYPARSLVHVNYFQPSKATEEKCNAWLLASSHVQGITQVNPNTICVLLNSPKTIEVPHLSEHLLRPNDLLLLPQLLKTWVNNITYHAYMNASFAKYLKKQHAQAEVDMFSEAMEHLSKFEGTSDGICSEPIMFDSRLPDNYLDDWFSESSLSFSSDTSMLL
ncbi:hypothetical protein BDR06DRAFT_977043 [Suillus hirtellus]|nr:hypothetical protein BDR06DRAFT_977043 [Suillus hirtellus]